MEAEELLKEIEASLEIMDMYRSYGQFVVEAIEGLRSLGEIVASPTEETIKEGLDIASKMHAELSPYGSYVPRVANTLDEALKWFQEKSQ